MKRAMVRRCRRSAGFTLIELLIVVAVMGLLAGLMVPRSDPSLHDQLQAAAQIVVGDLAYGRSLAVTNNSEYRFTFDTAGNRYILKHSGTDAALDPLPDSPFRSSDDPPDQQIVVLEELPHVGPTVRIAAVVAEGSASAIVGDVEFGALGATGRADETVVWLAAGAGAATRYVPVRINPVTGLATVGAFSAVGPAGE